MMRSRSSYDRRRPQLGFRHPRIARERGCQVVGIDQIFERNLAFGIAARVKVATRDHFGIGRRDGGTAGDDANIWVMLSHGSRH